MNVAIPMSTRLRSASPVLEPVSNQAFAGVAAENDNYRYHFFPAAGTDSVQSRISAFAPLISGQLMVWNQFPIDTIYVSISRAEIFFHPFPAPRVPKRVSVYARASRPGFLLDGIPIRSTQNERKKK